MSCVYISEGYILAKMSFRATNLSISAEFRPQFHMFCDSTTLSRTAASTYKDGLPKYAETPREVRVPTLWIS